MDDTIKKTDSYFLTNNQDLQYILAKVKKLREINEAVLSFIDPGIAKQCQVANTEGNKLVILAANGSIATQLRFQAPDILRQLHQHNMLQHIREIITKVGAPMTNRLTKTNTHLKKPAISDETSAVVKEMANMIDDPTLRNIMRKISENKNK